MKKSIGATWIVVFTCSISLNVVRADEISDNLRNHLTQPAMDALALDLGSLISGGSFHQGEALGFPIGVDVGLHASMVGIQSDDPILRDDGSTWESAFVQGELGLPMKLGLIARGGTLGSGTVFGAGLSYGLIKTGVPGLPSVMISGLYNQMDQTDIDVKTYTANVVASFNVPILHPYVGAGYDYTEVDPKSKVFESADPSIPRDLKGTSNGYRLEAGLNLSFIPFTYITLGAGLTNGQELYHAALGFKF